MKQMQKKCSPEEFNALMDPIVRKWTARQIKWSGADFQISGTENIPKDGPVLFVSNHQSNFDIAMFIAYMPKEKGYIAKSELLKVPLLRTWMTYLHCVFMDRSDIKKSAKAITEGVNTLKSGHSMVVFPEGTRSKTGRMGEFKGGSFKLATKSKVPIVPVTIDGSMAIMEANHYKIKPAAVTVTVHPAVETAGLTKEEESALPERIKQIIAQ